MDHAHAGYRVGTIDGLGHRLSIWIARVTKFSVTASFTGGGLAARQIRVALLVGVCLGIATTALQIGWDAHVQANLLDRRLATSSAVVSGSAANAAYNYDLNLAKSVVDGLIQNPAIRAASITSETGVELATGSLRQDGTAPSWIARLIFGDVDVIRLPLDRPSDNLSPEERQPEVIGYLEIRADTQALTGEIIDRGWQAVLAGLLRNTAFALLLTFFFHRLVTRPTLALADSVRAIDPKSLRDHEIKPPPGHEATELGEIASAVQGLVAGLGYELHRRIEAERSLDFQAHHDAATGLPNRRALEDAIARRIAASVPASLMIVDMVNLRSLNESYGRAFGDDVLRAIASRIKRMLRAEEVLSRLTGGDLALCLPGHSVDRIAETAARIIGAVSEPVTVQGHHIQVRVRIGVAQYDPRVGSDRAVTPARLLKRCDSAVNDAKRQGSQFRIFDETLEEANHRRNRIEAGLKTAMAERQIDLHYQPKIDLRTGRTIGLEALVRWSNPELGAVSPTELIPIAEESGQIMDLGAWIFDRVADQIAVWQRSHGVDIPVAVNVSGLQLSQQDILAETISNAARRAAIPIDRLEVELTETAMIADGLQAASESLTRLSDLGVRISIDDFGTGYTSLAYLARLPIHTLKIDRSFVLHLPDQRESVTLVRTITQMAHELGLTVVAEGAETWRQVDHLRSIGCDTVQGFYFSRPVEAREIPALLKTIHAIPGVA